MEVGASRQPAARGGEVLQAGQHRMVSVESLRAIAALAVMFGHAWGLGHSYGPTAVDTYFGRVVYGGGFGVFLFFALTGYLLFWPFAKRHFGDGAQIRLRGYAANRVVRILPLYLISVVVVLALQERETDLGTWLRFLLLAENFSAATVGQVNGVLWSLVVEVHFYALLPLLAVALGWVGRRSKARAAMALVVLGAVSLALWISYTLPAPGNPLWRYNLPATFFFFVPGMLLALLRLHWQEKPASWLPTRAASADAWLVGSVAVWLVVFWRYELAPLAAIASFAAVGACVLPLRPGPLKGVLGQRWLAGIGIASYSLYVWHTRIQENLARIDGFPTDTLGLTLITTPVSLLVAFVSYKVVEEPFLRLRRRWSTASAPIEPAAGAAARPAPAQI